MIVRLSLGILLGAVVTFVLFLLMQTLIHSDDPGLDERVAGRIVDVVRLEEQDQIETKVRKPKPPPPPDEPPPDMP